MTNNDQRVTIRDVYEQVGSLRTEMNNRMEDMEKRVVTKDRFLPVERLAYGLASTVLLSVVGAVLALVLKGQ